MRICTEAELRLILGIESTITDAERATLNLLHGLAEGAVKRYLGYDPVQASRTEYYPRHDATERTGRTWDTTGTHAILRAPRGSGFETLQLERLPVRSISSLLVHQSAHHGTGDDDFGADAEVWTEGTDYWAEYERDNYAPSGMLVANGSWPSAPVTVKVTYRGGYSTQELGGNAETTADPDGDGLLTTAGVDAGPIKHAAIMTVVQAFHTFQQFRKRAAGWVSGALQSENLGDYSYTLGTGGAAATALQIALPAAAEDALHDYRNWGILLR